MASAAVIIDKFGGTRAMASALELPPSTVQSWKVSGFIPARHQTKVLETARGLGLDLRPSDFFELPEDESPGPETAGTEEGAAA